MSQFEVAYNLGWAEVTTVGGEKQHRKMQDLVGRKDLHSVLLYDGPHPGNLIITLTEDGRVEIRARNGEATP